MTVLLYLVPAALCLGLLGLLAFMWSLRAGQYDDMEGAALRVLKDDDLEDGRHGAPGGERP
ncbi:cbb3-type cytochrome oxidase assembly protein CcoS [Ancylobacter radicis]|uniref:Cbb3-type cytochrome oxidase assembly protein CcoS n=1 Tax=Ancylobacter radicis TaxID=2836179 RepID=A0ABS5R504_9HYPH|nr:cbb3-type cytochrome oxidase assembly protein CcoS [Ancylobacter radicis]MBS9476755.1 cbb3-type cytochrome oxidase assembly protein CcoS [Ancylobacter radicis]